MIRILLSAAAAFVQSAEPKLTATAPRLFCEARTPTGATLSFTVDQVSAGTQTVSLATGREGSAWPAKGQTFLLLPSRQSSNETEYSVGPRLVRIKNGGFVRDVTFWATRDGKALQPVAFGFCAPQEFPPAAAGPAPSDDPFDPAKWKADCQMTMAAPQPVRSSFKMNQEEDSSKRFFVEFEGLTPSGKVAVPRELMKDAPPAEHSDVFMGVGRFKTEAGVPATSGMDAIYLDRKTSKATSIVRFTGLNGDQFLHFAICGSTIAKVEPGKPERGE